MDSPIKIRGHHLRNIAVIGSGATEQELGAALVKRGYVGGPTDPYVRRLYQETMKLVGDPTTPVQLVAGSQDYVCDMCPKLPFCDFVLRCGEDARLLPDEEYSRRTVPDWTVIEKLGAESRVAYPIGKVLRAFNRAYPRREW